MSKRNYERLDIYNFGKHLLSSGDLDPVYIILKNSDLDSSQLKRWLIAYWCLYHCGVASYLSELEGNAFWRGLEIAAANEDPAPTGGRWPRGSERRHWRGQQAITSCFGLENLYTDNPEEMVDYIAGAGGAFQDVAGRTQEHRGFGPWIAFKVCDMVERVLDIHVDFNQAAVFMFKDPVEAALMLWRKELDLSFDARPKNKKKAIDDVVKHLSGYFSGVTAPPGGREINLQEIETILCKWKSHMNGHYPLFNDTLEIQEGLLEWTPHSKTAERLSQVAVAEWSKDLV